MNKESTKVCAKLILALHRKDSKILEEILDQRLKQMSCKSEPGFDIGHDYRKQSRAQKKLGNLLITEYNGWEALVRDGFPSIGLKVAKL